LLIVPQFVAAQTTQNNSPAGLPVPNWLAWKIFHQSLAFYNQRSAEQLQRMLKTEFGVTNAQAAILLQSGQSFVTTVEQIDKDGKTEAERRYPEAVKPTNGSPWRRPRGSSSKNLRERFLEDGLYAEVEARKEATLVTHIGILRSNLNPAQFDAVAKWVQTAIAPRIKLVTGATRVSGLPKPPDRPPIVQGQSLGK
jgi:hypothetical protein